MLREWTFLEKRRVYWVWWWWWWWYRQWKQGEDIRRFRVHRRRGPGRVIGPIILLPPQPQVGRRRTEYWKTTYLKSKTRTRSQLPTEKANELVSSLHQQTSKLVVGRYKSGKYDLNVLKDVLLPHLVNNQGIKFVVQKNEAYLAILFDFWIWLTFSSKAQAMQHFWKAMIALWKKPVSCTNTWIHLINCKSHNYHCTLPFIAGWERVTSHLNYSPYVSVHEKS